MEFLPDVGGWLFLGGVAIVAGIVVIAFIWAVAFFQAAEEIDDCRDRMSDEWLRCDWAVEKPSLRHQRVARRDKWPPAA